MNEKWLENIIKSGNIVMPLCILKQIKKLKLEMDEFVFLMYLYNRGNKVVFNPQSIAEDLNISIPFVMKYISSLTEKSYINVEVLKNDKNIMEEYIFLDNFFKKISIILIDDNESAPKEESNIFSEIEKEFGRTLAPTEYELIKAWMASNMSEELIILAVKETVINGVNNLRYVDKILYEWSKKGIKNSEDVIKEKNKFRNQKDSNVEVFEYNWLDDNE